MEKSRQFRVYARHKDVVENKDWGGTSYDVYNSRGEFMDHLTQPPMDPSHLPPVLYHATTNLPAVQSSGYLRAFSGGDVGGLGGGHENTVSVTTERDIAHGIAKDMRSYATLIHTGSMEAVMDWLHRKHEEHGIPFHQIQNIYDTYRRNEKHGVYSSFGSMADHLASLHFAMRASAKAGRNPIILGGTHKEDSPWWNVDPRNTGVVAFHRGDIPHEALISSFDYHYHPEDFHSMREVRVHADIPLGRATRFDRIG